MTRTRLLGPVSVPWIVACLIALAWPASAGAQAADIVSLPNGGRLRGTVEVYEPGERVVILLPDGSRRTLGAGEFERVQFGDTPEASAAAPESATADAAPESAGGEPPVVQASPPDAGGAASDAEVQQLEAVVPAVAGEAPSGALVIADGRRDEVPWNAVDPRTQLVFEPRGMVHLVVEGRLGVGIRFDGEEYGVNSFWEPFPIGGDLAVGADVRVPSTILHFRAAGVLGLQTHDADDGKDRYDFPPGVRAATGFGYAGIRGLVSFDANSWVTVGLGGELGFEVLPVFDSVHAYGGPELDLVFRALSDRRLEIGFALSVQDRNRVLAAQRDGYVLHSGTDWLPRLALTIGGVFL